MKKILLAIVMLSTVSFYSCNSGGGDPKAVLGQFFTALSKNDIEGARKLATKDSKSMIDMMEMGMKMGKDKSESDKFKPDNMEIGEAKIDGDKAIISVKEKTSGETMNYNLKKEDGGWKVAFDKASVMSMGMEKMNEKGINPTDSIDAAMDKLKDINMDSLKDKMQEGMKVLDTINKSLKDK
jgi:Domain of unknown function (DUF4878)